jgi:glutamate/tyrosine decarboxylase-like PLP-dependent enzyme
LVAFNRDGQARMTLDPNDFASLRRLGHRMVDDVFDQLEQVRNRPVWQRMPEKVRTALRTPYPREANDPGDIYSDYVHLISPYPTGNTHPRFMGWVHGGGNAVGMLAELLAAGLNANLGGRDHAPIEVERQVIRWAAELLGFPPESSGLLVTGTSIANLIGVLVARTAALGRDVRRAGLRGAKLVAYTSEKAHGCIARAMDMAGLGTDALRLIASDAAHRMDVGALAATIKRDRAEGRLPFMLVGTAGTVDIGAFDDLAGLGTIARAEGLWFHIDAAFGAMAALTPTLRPLLTGADQADSLAFDFHKWMQVPYDAGCILVRNPVVHLAAFTQQVAYLRRETRGLAGGHPWPCDLGPDLSRGFRALKVWMTWRAYGSDRLGEVVSQTCDVARVLAARVDREPGLERLAPVPLNIVCFRVRGTDKLNREIVADIQEAGIAAPSTTIINGRLAIRAAIVNHRTLAEDAEALVDAVLGAARARQALPAGT